MSTVKITMLRNPARSANCNLKEGETGEVPAGQAEWLVGKGLAVLVNPPAKIIKAIPEPATIVAVEPEPEQTPVAVEPEPETEPTIERPSSKKKH